VAHPASYSVGTVGSYTTDKVVRLWRWPLTSVLSWALQYMQLPPHPTHCFSGVHTGTISSLYTVHYYVHNTKPLDLSWAKVTGPKLHASCFKIHHHPTYV
jgi:hypothetical protein